MAADIQVILEVLGAEDMEKAARATVTLTNKVDRLGKQLKKGTIDNTQFQRGVQQLIKKNAELGGGYKNLQKEVQRYAFSMQRRINEEIRAEAAVENVIRTTNNYTQATNRATVATTNAAEAAARHAAAQRMAGKSTNRFGMVAQQVGYQVGDFFVQVQSGTNALVAFGQQGTQLAGLLPGLGGAIVGIGLSLGTMLGGMFMRTRQEMEDTTKAVDELREALEMLEQVDLSNATSQVSQFAAQATYKYSILLEEIRKVAEEERARGFSTILDSFAPTAEIEKRRKSIEQMVKLANDAGMETNANIETQKRLLQDQVKTREILLGIEGKTRQETAENLNNALALLRTNGLLTPELRTQLTTFAEQSGLISAMQSDMEDVTREIEESKKEASFLSEVFDNMSISHLLGQFDSLSGKVKGILEQANSRLGIMIFGGGTLTGVLGSMPGMTMGRGMTPDDVVLPPGLKPGMTTGAPLSVFQDLLPPAPYGSSTGSSSGGGGGVNPIEQAEEYLQKLQREAEFKSTLIGLSDEQVAQETRREQLLNQLNGYEEGLGNQYSERIEQIIQMEAETRKLMEAEQQREQMMDMIESNIENAFMSIVDGSKSVEDAFKGMLRNIILEIYKTKVAKPAANAIMDLLFKADGGAFHRGVEMFANGGVVNAPTGFRHSGGLGIMGEAGPEAIMPLKRGKNGKLGVQMEGSGGDVVINQSFNFAANGDESVKRIIRGEVPRITEATKVAVLDAKRRGGSYGRAF